MVTEQEMQCELYKIREDVRLPFIFGRQQIFLVESYSCVTLENWSSPY